MTRSSTQGALVEARPKTREICYACQRECAATQATAVKTDNAYFLDAFYIARPTMTSENSFPAGLQDMREFGLVEALVRRRARRFFMQAENLDGALAYKSRRLPRSSCSQEPLRLSSESTAASSAVPANGFCR